MHFDQNIQRMIIRLFSGEASREEKKDIENWLNQKPENRKLLNDLKEIWLTAGIEQNADHYEVERAVGQFRQKIRFTGQKAVLPQRIPRLIRYAAVLLLLIALPLSYYYGKKSTPLSGSFTTISCAQGDKTAIVLPDSSQVILNSGSRLTFNNNFQNGPRQVFLDGEAYFSVQKRTQNPFRVKTSDIEVEVLGTEFNLKAYSDEETTTTTLVTGCLKVTQGDNSTLIKPNQKLVYNKKSGNTDLSKINDLAPETEWKDGRLVFRNQSLEELEHKLERWFDVEIEFADEQVKSRRFTGTLERESILEVISYFGRSKYVAYQIKDNKITFYTEQ